MDEHYDVAVVGLGLFGSAALRHLARRGISVVGIGPGEPVVAETHEGVFASHHDSGRITRRIDADEVWATLADRAIAEYPAIAQQSGIEFHTSAGLLWVDRDEHRVAAIEDVVARHGIDATIGSFSEQAASFPHLEFPGDRWSLFEGAPAGHVDPRRLKAAQLEAASRAGAEVVEGVVVDHATHNGRHHLRAKDGTTIDAASVLLAAGSYTRDHSVLPRPVPLRVKSETIVLGEVGDTEADILGSMPSVIYGLDHPVVSDVYVVPPVRYPDGKRYVKIGANTIADRDLASVDEINTWMRSGDTHVQAEGLEEVLRAMLPGTVWESFTPKRCIISYTPHGHPYVDHLGGQVHVAAGGNGMGAKCSDAVGALAAALVTSQAWTDELPAGWFAVPDAI